MERLVIPEYTIPPELEKVLAKDLKIYDGMSNESLLYLRALQALKSAKSIDITEKHYLLLLKLALHLEEYQCNVDMKKYELSGVKIARPNVNSNTFQITVEEIDEEKPWIRANDFVDVVDTTSHVRCSLKVTNIQQNNIIASDESSNLCKIYAADKLYDVKFRFQNYPLRCSHFALSRIRQQEVTTYLFPNKWKPYMPKELIFYNDLKAFNPSIAKNPEQKKAVIHIMNKSSFPAPYILYGPPGTGKTETLIEAMCQILSSDSKQRILVCTPSNTAADEIARRLLTHVLPGYIYRIYSQSKDTSTMSEEMRLCSNYEGGKIAYVKNEVIEKKRIVITTLCNCMRLIQMRLDPSFFSHVIIDEAGQSTEPDILIPISLVSKAGKLYSQIVVTGDPQQLGPTVMSKVAEIILGRTILERLMSYDIYQKDHNMKYNPKYVTKLLINYRSHPSILHLSNKLFYDNELYSQFRNKCENNMFPILFHGVRGKEDKYFYSPSSFNHAEIRVVLDYVDKLIENKMGLELGGVLPEDIGIVTPFALQSKVIRNKLKSKNLKEINVGTVELFQGQERKVMILTTVRSKAFFHDGQRHIGSLSNPKRFNVAVTRAKNLLIVVGNPTVLQIDYKWHYLLKYCVDNNAYRGIKFFLSPLSDKQSIELEKPHRSSELFMVTDPLKSDFGSDFLKPLDAILYPKVLTVQKPTRKVGFTNQDKHKNKGIHNTQNIRTYTPVTSNYYNYKNSYSTGFTKVEEKKSSRCAIL